MTDASVVDGWERLTAANDDIDAQLLVGILDEAGIETRTVKDRSGYGDYLRGGSNPWAPVVVHVHASELDAARRVLSEVRPPEVSESSDQPIRGVRWYTIVAAAIAALMIALFVMEQRDLLL